MPIVPFLLGALAVCAAGEAEIPGIVLDQRTTHIIRSLVGMVQQDETIRVHLAPGACRMDTKGSEFVTIYRVDEDRVLKVELNTAARLFSSSRARPPATTPLPASPAGDALDAISGGPGRGEPEEEGEVEIRPHREGARVIAGRRCRGFVFFVGGRRTLEAWYTEEPAPKGLRRLDVESYPVRTGRKLLEARLGRRGLELESTMYFRGGGLYEVRTQGVEEKKLREEVFLPPPGYKEARTVVVP